MSTRTILVCLSVCIFMVSGCATKRKCVKGSCDNGIGTYYFKDKSIILYEGGWKNKDFHGSGIIKFADGTIMVKRSLNGENHGFNFTLDKNGNIMYGGGDWYYKGENLGKEKPNGVDFTILDDPTKNYDLEKLIKKHL